MKGRVIAALQVTILGVVLGAILLETPAQAVAWTDKNHIVTEVQDINMAEYPYTDNSLPGCRFMPVGVSGESGTHQACVANAKDYSLATVTGSDLLHIRIGRDTAYRKIENYIVHSTEVYYVSSAANRLVMKTVQYPRFERLHIYHNFIEHLTPVTTFENGQVYTKYQGDGVPDFVLKYQDGSDTPVNYGQLSSNGRYFVFQIAYSGLARIDTETLEVKRFTDAYAGQYGGASYTFGVSDSGQSVVVTGKNVGITLYQLTGVCGVSGVDDPAGSYACSSIDLSEPLEEALGQGIGNTILINTTFINEYKFQTQVAQQNVVFMPTGYTEPRLEYLALGDSISSGEGDTSLNLATKQKYYREYTDAEEDAPLAIPREKCHLSTRSYPYRLAVQMHLGRESRPKQWDSVACSGARTIDMYGNASYSGQNKGPEKLWSDGDMPRLEGYANKTQLQALALNEMVPGRVEQIEFVKKYQPSVITLTVGANNVGFADKLQACLSPEWTLGIPHPATCDWADSKKSDLAKQIQEEYDDLVNLYRKLYDASGKKAKIYVLGYPRLISSDEPAHCGLNIGSLDHAERTMIADATNYLNRVIERAANAAGATYVDIADSLDGGKLCDEGQEYVTGVAFAGNSERQESFHPNAGGQGKIAQAVQDALHDADKLDCGASSTLATCDVCPSTTSPIDVNCPKSGEDIEVPPITDFSGVLSDDQTRSRNQEIMTRQVEKLSENKVTLEKYSLKPGSTATLTFHSDPVDLGNYVVAADGSFDQTITLPASVPVGYHTMILAGETYSGEPIEIMQVILVTGTDPDDLDDNGIIDSQQPCGPFLPSSGQDADFDGIDDACDPEISSEPQLYRIRTGDPERIYGLQPEHENYLYIERNTRASSITGITGDYDPDGDDWAIVGASQGVPYTTSSVPDTAPAANFIVIGEGASAKPYVYIRAGGYGCTSFTPTNLAQVQDGQVRTIKKVDYNTDKCRQEAPDYDVDGNGQPDDTQPLYMARSGDLEKGEDPARVYLYRNFYAAEAQLGISDYTPTGTPVGNSDQPIQSWNLLASSKPNVYIPTLNKLVVLEDNNGKPLPTILTKKQNGQCIAYQPENTGIIKMTTQNTRYLVKLANMPGGVDCE